MEYIKYSKGTERVREAALALLDWIGMCGQLNEDEIELRNSCLKFIRKGEDNETDVYGRRSSESKVMGNR